MDDSNSAIIGVINPEIDSINKDLLNNIDNTNNNHNNDNRKDVQNEILDSDNENQVLEEPENIQNQPEEIVNSNKFNGNLVTNSDFKRLCSFC